VHFSKRIKNITMKNLIIKYFLVLTLLFSYSTVSAETMITGFEVRLNDGSKHLITGYFCNGENGPALIKTDTTFVGSNFFKYTSYPLWSENDGELQILPSNNADLSGGFEIFELYHYLYYPLIQNDAQTFYEPASIEGDYVVRKLKMEFFNNVGDEFYYGVSQAGLIGASHTSSSIYIEESTDGVNFIATGRVSAAGNSQSELTYTYVDDQLNGDNYYRLRIVDFDGSYDYSDIVHVTADCARDAVIPDVFPNPVRESLSIRFNSEFDHETATVVVIDNLGRTVMTEGVEVFSGANVIELNVNTLPQATYYITIEGENGWFKKPTSFVKIN